MHPELGAADAETKPEDGKGSGVLKRRRSLAVTLMRADAQNRQGRNCSARPGTSVIGGAVDAMRKLNDPSAPAAAPALQPQSSGTVVDLHQNSFGRIARMISRAGTLSRSKRKGGRYGTPAPREWSGAAKLVRDLGENQLLILQAAA